MISRIKSLCASNNISLAELERELHFSKGSMSKWKKNAPSIDKAQKVADYFGVTLDYLIGRSDDPYTESDFNEEELMILEAYKGLHASDKPAIKALAAAFDKLLKLDED